MLVRFRRLLSGPVYELDGAAFATYWLIQARKIGASMDQLAKGLR
jgi:hypothetical protein